MSAAALALLAVATGSPPEIGLWEGTVGTLPIVACFGQPSDGFYQGSYYYRDHLVPIGLSGSGNGRWSEDGEDDGPRWQVGAVGDGLAGTWRDGRKRLPIRLQRQPFTTGADGDAASDACHSAEWLAPRAFSPLFETDQAQIGGWRYDVVRWIPPKQFADDSASGFAFTPVKPGDASILASLRKAVPSGAIDDDFMSCVTAGNAFLGIDGSWDVEVRPVLASGRYLSVRTQSSSFCGGAHPNFGVGYTLYDRETGEPVDVAAWLSPAGFVRGAIGYTISPALRSLAADRLFAGLESGDLANTADDEGCREAVAGQDYWTVGVVAGGMVLMPELPHVLTACVGEATLPWSDLAPFLSPDGKAAVASLDGES